MRPASVMTMAITKASRGRSMKILESISSLVFRHDACRDGLTGTHLLDPLHDDQLALLETAGYHNVPTLLAACGNAAHLDLSRLVHHEHIAARLIEQNGGLGNEQRRLRRAPFHGYPDNPAGDQNELRVRHFRPYRHSVGIGIDLDVEEVAEAGMRID